MVRNAGFGLSALGFRWSAAGALAATCFAAACTPTFQSASDVTDLRVLAVRADPPEAHVDLDGGTVDDVRVHVLVADPNAGAHPAVVDGQLCFPTDNLLCDPGSPPTQLHARAPVGDVVLPTISIPAGMVEAALQNDRLKGLGGVRVQLSLSVDTLDPHGPVQAEKTLLYSAAAKPNHNPQIVRLALTRDSVSIGTLEPGQGLSLNVGVAVGIRPLLPCADDAPLGCDGGEEHFDTTDLTGATVHLREQILWSFFTTAGAEVDRTTADEPLPELAQPTNGIFRITASTAASGTLWIVGRDGRGGIAWQAIPWSAH